MTVSLPCNALLMRPAYGSAIEDSVSFFYNLRNWVGLAPAGAAGFLILKLFDQDNVWVAFLGFVGRVGGGGVADLFGFFCQLPDFLSGLPDARALIGGS